MVLMVQQHLGIWLVDREAYAHQIQAGLGYINMAGGLAAPLFVTLAGVAVGLTKASPRQLTSRGLVLVLFGGLLNLLVPSWFSWGSFYVLHLLGVWLLLCGASGRSLRAPNGVRLWAPLWALFFLVGAVVGQSLLDTPLALTNPMMRRLDKPGGVFRLALWEGQFPIFPWLSLCLGGLWASAAVRENRLRPLFVGAALSAVLALCCRAPVSFIRFAAFLHPWRSVCRTSFFPLSTFAALGLFSLCLALIGVFLWLERTGKLSASSWLIPLGRSSLSALFFHVLVFREGLERLQLRHTLHPALTAVVIGAFLAIWVAAARKWSHVDYRYGLEWWLRKWSPAEAEKAR